MNLVVADAADMVGWSVEDAAACSLGLAVGRRGAQDVQLGVGA